ncbi:MAG: hypothetical protein OXE48_08460 [Gammaproteobacteria bacterium]|nr:hypothetical protein [Gammaproteobacteria bacterium]
MALTARDAVTLNTTSAPSVTAALPCRAMLTVGGASGVAVTVADAAPFSR